MSGTPITSDLRNALFFVWGNKCAYCGAKAEHVDHLQPRSKGGADCLTNYVPACSRCNLTKSAMVIEDAYLGLLRARIRERLSKVEDKIHAQPRRREKQDADVDVITRVDLNVSDVAIEWTARQKAEPWCYHDPVTAVLMSSGLIILDLRRNKKVFASYSETVPVWQSSSRSKPLVEKGVSPGFPSLFAMPELVKLARLATELGARSFEFTGPIVPRSAKLCRAFPEGYGLSLPASAIKFLAGYPHDIRTW